MHGVPVFKKQWPAFILAFVIPLVVVCWWWGGFSKVRITEGEAGPYRFAYLEHDGDIGNIRKTQKKVFDALVHSGVDPGENIIVLLTDPRTTPKTQQRALAGYMIGPDAKLPSGIKEETLPRRKVIMATVKAGILIAPSKAYQALYDYLKPSGRDIHMPTVEIYHTDDTVTHVGQLTVEMQP
jgi:DNA gyrase inhibitor GyrI